MPAYDGRLFLGGEWKKTSRSVDIRSPWDNTVVGSVALADDAAAEEAIAKGLNGFERTRSLSSFERYEILSHVSARIRERKNDLAALITAESGKPISLARVEVDRAVLTTQLAAEEARRIDGEGVSLDFIPSAKDRFGIVRRFPVGLILGITPFNFPLNLVCHKLAPAFAGGNAFLLKPSPQAPLTSLLLGEIVEESGYPREAFSILTCTNDIAARLVQDDRINMVSFTGSPAVGWGIKSNAGKKKVVLELGGNAGAIVDRTADVAETARKTALGSFSSSGQTCIKVQRIYVHREIHGAFVHAFLDATKALVVGDPRDEKTVLGPLIDAAAADRVESWIQEASENGARVLYGGVRKGNIIGPTILSGVRSTDKVFCREVFGPVVTLHSFDTIEEAVAGINNSSFGLQAGIFSNDLRNILYAFKNIVVGALIVNDNPSFRVDNMPYGGVKDSGFGREGVRYAIESMTEPRLLALNPP